MFKKEVHYQLMKKTKGQINNLFENKEQEINSQEKNLVKEQIIQKTDQQQLIQTSTQS